jgi:hypothetical protein
MEEAGQAEPLVPSEGDDRSPTADLTQLVHASDGRRLPRVGLAANKDGSYGLLLPWVIAGTLVRLFFT